MSGFGQAFADAVNEPTGDASLEKERVRAGLDLAADGFVDAYPVIARNGGAVLRFAFAQPGQLPPEEVIDPSDGQLGTKLDTDAIEAIRQHPVTAG